jgi:hypothetical protein
VPNHALRGKDEDVSPKALPRVEDPGAKVTRLIGRNKDITGRSPIMEIDDYASNQHDTDKLEKKGRKKKREVNQLQ